MEKITPSTRHYTELRARSEEGLDMPQAAHDLKTASDRKVAALELPWFKIPIVSHRTHRSEMRIEASIDKSAGDMHKLIFHVLDISDNALRVVNERVRVLLANIFAQIPGDLLVIADPNPIFRNAWDLIVARVPATHSAFLFAKIADEICTSFGGPSVYDAARAAALGAVTNAVE